MELNENGYLAKFYRFVFGNLPYDFCTLFWNTLFAFLLFPIYIPTRIFNGKWEFASMSLFKRTLHGVGFWVASFFISVLGVGALHKIFGLPLSFWLLPIGFFIFPVVILLSVGAIIGVGEGIKYLWNKLASKTSKKVHTPNVISASIATIRNKYCTKITWK